MAIRRSNTKYSEFFLYTEALCEILPLILLFTAAALIFGIWSPGINPQYAPYMPASELAGNMAYFPFFVPFFFIYRLFSFLWEQRRADFYLSGARGTVSHCAVRLAAALTGEIICTLIPLFLRLFVFFNEPFSVLRRLNIICGTAAVALAVTAFSLVGILIARGLAGGAVVTAGLIYSVYLTGSFLYSAVSYRLYGISEAVQPFYSAFQTAFDYMNPFSDIHGTQYETAPVILIYVMSVLILTVCFVWLRRRCLLKRAGTVTKTVYITGAVLLLMIFVLKLSETSTLWLFSGLLIFMMPKTVSVIRQNK